MPSSVVVFTCRLLRYVVSHRPARMLIIVSLFQFRLLLHALYLFCLFSYCSLPPCNSTLAFNVSPVLLTHLYSSTLIAYSIFIVSLIRFLLKTAVLSFLVPPFSTFDLVLSSASPLLITLSCSSCYLSLCFRAVSTPVFVLSFALHRLPRRLHIAVPFSTCSVHLVCCLLYT